MKERERRIPGADTSGIDSKRFVLYDNLAASGFTAGMTLKNDWSSPSEVYRYIADLICGGRKRLVVPIQQHGARIAKVGPSMPDLPLEVDGVLSSNHDLCLTVTTADCLPMLVADPRSGYFGAIHIGWRSFICGILDNFSMALEELGIDLSQLRVSLGPAIGACCFEVGHDVAALWEPRYIREETGRQFVDLRKAVGNKIISMGVDKANIENLEECSSCFGDRYYSYRRDRMSPIQMVSFIFGST